MSVSFAVLLSLLVICSEPDGRSSSSLVSFWFSFLFTPVLLAWIFVCLY